jgi:hypothetical protein
MLLATRTDYNMLAIAPQSRGGLLAFVGVGRLREAERRLRLVSTSQHTQHAGGQFFTDGRRGAIPAGNEETLALRHAEEPASTVGYCVRFSQQWALAVRASDVPAQRGTRWHVEHEGS